MEYDATLNTSSPGTTPTERELGDQRLHDEEVGGGLEHFTSDRTHWRARCHECGRVFPYSEIQYVPAKGYCCGACRGG